MIFKMIVSIDHLICNKGMFSRKTVACFESYRVFVSFNQILGF